MILPECFQRLIWLPLRVFMIMLCSLKINGAENIKNLTGNMILASNHQSELDPLLLVACLPFFSRRFPIIYVTRETKYYKGDNWSKWKRIAYGGTFFRIIGGYQSYAGMKDYKLALPHHLDTLKLGHNVGIFPVGKIIKNKDGVVKARGGVTFLAQQSNAPVIPVRIQGLENLSLKNVFQRNLKATVTFGAPIYLKDFIRHPHKMSITEKINHYEIVASKIWKKIEDLE